jgi:micrococcal nuclease
VRERRREWGRHRLGPVVATAFVAAIVGAGAVVASAPGGAAARTDGVVRRPPERRATLARVVDGDTLKLTDGTRVRLIGIDTPEVAHPGSPGDECFGPQATRETERLLHPGDRLRLVLDADHYDQYGRLLAYVYRAADDLFVNARLLDRGYAYLLTVSPNVAHVRQFRLLARGARLAGRGLWSACARA